MSYLLDTNMLIWLVADRSRIKTSLIKELEDPSIGLSFSVVSMWEIGIKRSIARIEFTPDKIADGALKTGISMLGIGVGHCQSISALGFPGGHKDPFDRMLVAQAKVEGLTLLTSDSELGQYGSFVRVV